MYDPTIFENLKVAFENQIYDLDNIDRKITILNRKDQMDFAILSRSLSIQFSLVDQPEVTAEIILAASLEELAREILAVPGKQPGCSLLLRFSKHVHHVTEQCERIEQALYAIWENDIELTQTLSFNYRGDPSRYLNTLEVKFKPKLGEKNMGELPDFLDSVMETLRELSKI
ncbi:hypothetical protein DCC39_01990 [Pueribacillus theae]|uniref:Uncharacterized protein n=1 Tax=Pueribacillus theae TaxID=2171751 RepID=A0A2U1K7V6_9BACI|nr:hypothetical protein [Pueribacillus theae]PWA13239.1 hypothetical protein DCC39_01990 [Pueribacillus theae]